jgi:hypothetical protein
LTRATGSVEIFKLENLSLQPIQAESRPRPTHNDAARRNLEREHNQVELLTALFFLGIAAVLIAPFFSHASWLVFVQDDLLYYLKVAQNLAHGHGSTFNGIVPTNGYQPLWFLILTALSRFTQNSTAILAFLALSDFVAAILTFILARRLLRLTGVRPLAVFALAAWTTLYSLTLFFYGMETTLTVPILFAVLCTLRRTEWLERSPLHTFALGLLFSAMALSRIDTLIFGALLLAGIVLTPGLRGMMRPRLLAGLVVGMLPIAVYVFINHFYFHTWMPISGMAKELKFGHIPSLEPWRVFFHPLAAAYAVLMIVALALLVKNRARIAPIDRVLFASTLLFPFIYYSALSVVSDWTLWGWYMYPLRTAVCVSFVILCLTPFTASLFNRRPVAVLMVLTVFAGLALMRWTRQQSDIYEASVDIVSFAQSHPGVYAMGDRAGRVAYLLDQPIIQTEGLMMDRSYLDLIASQTPLRAALARYNVRYYVATAYHPFTGCFEASEPAKAGPASAHMRAEFCSPPLATFLHNGHQTLIFDMKP